MKGVILAGGYGTRLQPLTKLTNKHLLPIGDRFMIHYPLQTLMDAGIKDIMIITGKESCGDFMKLLGSGKEFGCKFTYKIQEEANGIAGALSLAEDFANKEAVAVILGDNIFEDKIEIDFKDGAMLFLKEVKDANRFGVAEIKDDRIINIEEKPPKPKTNYAVTGLYVYDSKVFDFIRTLKPSKRGELEITDVNNHYVRNGEMRFSILKGYWTDAGTHESLYRAIKFVNKNL